MYSILTSNCTVLFFSAILSVKIRINRSQHSPSLYYIILLFKKGRIASWPARGVLYTYKIISIRVLLFFTCSLYIYHKYTRLYSITDRPIRETFQWKSRTLNAMKQRGVSGCIDAVMTDTMLSSWLSEKHAASSRLLSCNFQNLMGRLSKQPPSLSKIRRARVKRPLPHLLP